MAPDSPEWFRLGPDAPTQKLFLIDAPQQAVFTLDSSGVLWITRTEDGRLRTALLQI